MPLHYVDLLAAQFVDYVLDPYPPQPDAGADGIDAFVACRHRDLAAVARFTGDSLQLYGAAAYLGDLQLEEAAQQVAMGARYDHLGTPAGAAHLNDVCLDPLAWTVVVGAHLLSVGQHTLGLAQVEDDLAGLLPLDDAGDELVLTVGKLLEDQLPLGLAQAL